MIRWIFITICVWGVSGASLAFEGQDQTSPGTMAMKYKRRSNIWARWDLGIVDARITSTPPDATKLDRRLESFGMLGFDAAISQRFGFRLNARSETSERRRSEEEPPRADVKTLVRRYDAEADVTFVTDKGLEIFGGLMVRHLPASATTISTDSSEQTSAYDPVNIRSNRFGVVRRGGIWSGGFYYEIGGEADRGYELSASDGTSTAGTEVVFIPQRVGVFAEFAAAGFGWDFEFDFVQARGLGPRDDQGNTIYTDYFSGKIGSYFGFTQTFGIYSAFSHRTLSYSNSAFVEMDTMPISTARFLLMQGGQESHFYTGIIGSYGEDGQSLPEFNTSYEYRAFAATFGLFYPF